MTTPILLIPGLLCTAEVFAPQVAALWPYGPVTVASTMAGESIGEMAATILASAPPRFALAGFSMGGFIAFEIVRLAPDRVVKLALLDTSARPDTAEETAARRAFIAAARTIDAAALLPQALSTILHPSRQNDPALRAVNLRMGLTVGIDGLVRQSEAIIARADVRPRLSAIAVPTLVLVGDGDVITPPACSEEIAAAVPGAKLVVVPACGHQSTLERPEADNRALVE